MIGESIERWRYTILVFLVVSIVFSIPLVVSKPSPSTIGKSIFLATIVGVPMALLSAYLLTPLNMWKLKLRPLEGHPANLMLEELSRAAKLKTPKLLVLNTVEVNAFAYLSPFGKRVVLTRGLIEAFERGYINEDELKGIIAHELGHHKNGDCLRQSLVFSLVSIFDFISNAFLISGMTNIGWSASPWIDDETRTQYYLAGIILLIIGTLIKIPVIVTAIIAFHHSRKLEFAADAFAAKLTSPKIVANALQKIEALNAQLTLKNLVALPFPDRWTLRPKNVSPIERLFESHPPIEKRVKALLS